MQSRPDDLASSMEICSNTGDGDDKEHKRALHSFVKRNVGLHREQLEIKYSLANMVQRLLCGSARFVDLTSEAEEKISDHPTARTPPRSNGKWR